MKENLRQLVRRIFLGATAAIAASTVSIPKNIEAKDLRYDDTNREEALKTLKESNSQKLVLMKPTDGTLTSFVFHRSHRSHSSHRSHYSSYTQPSKPKKEEPKKEEPKVQEKETKKSNLIDQYELGSRVLEKGMKGMDVAELQDSLVSKGYELKITGLFDDATEIIVKKFQEKMNLKETGKVDFLTMYFLKKR